MRVPDDVTLLWSDDKFVNLVLRERDFWKLILYFT